MGEDMTTRAEARAVTTVIDPELCTGCGRCVGVCPSDTLSLVDGKARVTGADSLNCGHCEAACPEGAIRVGGAPADTLAFRTVALGDRSVAPGESDAAEVLRLLGSRRSCRRFATDPVDPDVLDDLVRAGTLAPSGTNSQLWTFTILPDRARVEGLARGVADFFRLLNRLSAFRAVRFASRFAPGDPLGTYHREYSASVAEALSEWERGGRERLFHGAPAAIVIATRRGASTATEDALLAAQNILLAAHALGYGTCLIGFAVAAMHANPRLQARLGIPGDEKVRAVIAVGRSKERYVKLAARKRAIVRTAPPAR